LLQPTVLLGVISSLTGIALQEQIVRNVQEFHYEQIRRASMEIPRQLGVAA
jgi:hypothetical protein